jgi:hypothetical protein
MPDFSSRFPIPTPGFFPPSRNFSGHFPQPYSIPRKLPSLLTEENLAYLMGKNAVGVQQNIP